MSETIYKLQPGRTMHLRGFDGRGASAALHSASDSGFTVSGVFRDMADFAVLMLWDADDYFEHPTMKHLPDFDFRGLVLSFDVLYSGLQPLDSQKYNWIDWATLDVLCPDGSSAQVRLSAHATRAAGTWAKAQTSFVLGSSLTPWSHITLWYQNIAFDYWGDGVNTPTVSDVLTSIAGQINNYNWTGMDMSLTASVGGDTLTVQAGRAGEDGNHIRLIPITNGVSFADATNSGWLAGGSSDATWHVSLDFSALGIEQLRQAWLTFSPKLPRGTAYVDTEWSAVFSNWFVTDVHGYRALKVAGDGSVRIGSRDPWATFSGQSWVQEASNQSGGTGWFYHGFARRAATTGDRVTVKYHCHAVHDLYLGTSLYKDRGIVSVSVDSHPTTTLDCFLWVDAPVVTRRLLQNGMAAGEHTVVLTVSGNRHVAAGTWDHDSLGTYFYFDFVEAAVAADVPAPAQTYTGVTAATDWDTDHGYKLSPQRLAWNLDRLGFHGDVNHYLGVFWWAQRCRINGSFPSKTVVFGGTWAYQDSIIITIGSTAMGKSVFPTDTAATIAAHFAAFINETFVGLWAEASSGTLTIHNLTPLWSFTYSSTHTSQAGTMTESGSLDGGVEGTWQIDASKTPVLNRAATDWHLDFWKEIHSLGLGGAASFSMELVNPPDNPPASVWAQRFADGTAAATDTGFASLKSTQCVFGTTFRAYQQQAFKEMAGLMSSAGMTPWLQFGEFLWWYFDWYASPVDGQHVAAGMAFYDAETTAAAEAALGRALASFSHTTDDPSVNDYADANFLRERIKTHTDAIAAFVKATYPEAKFELLWPYDVNYPTLTPVAQLGGRLNRYVNLPSEFAQKAGSGVDRFKMEALAFGSQERNLNMALQAMNRPYAELAWEKADIGYLVPCFNGGCPWATEYLQAKRESIPLIVFWALDHFCLMGENLPLPVERVAGRVI
jgi:hypothetical protein